MVTDGMMELSPETGENWLLGALREVKHHHPQIVADRLIEEACYRWPKGIKDDLTVLVCRVQSLFEKKKEKEPGQSFSKKEKTTIAASF
ncbi:MAG: SpoIIE family protein phosphatase, partial [Firmicutes bacterium]|nr:SpoIIE family protein phosphatase [Bacillota bacterium]